jgi:hypothetical protein
MKSKNQPTSFDIEAELRRSFGVDLTRIDGIKAMTAQVILSEIGPDCSAFPSEGDFASWLELTPRRDITGGKVIQQKARKSNNRVANALRSPSPIAIPIWGLDTVDCEDEWKEKRQSRLWLITWPNWYTGW